VDTVSDSSRQAEPEPGRMSSRPGSPSSSSCRSLSLSLSSHVDGMDRATTLGPQGSSSSVLKAPHGVV
jgi:hypothetical protein